MTPPQALQPIRLYPQLRTTTPPAGRNAEQLIALQRWVIEQSQVGKNEMLGPRRLTNGSTNANKLIALNPIGWFCHQWAAGAIAENASRIARIPAPAGTHGVAVAARRAVAFARPQSQVLRTAWRRRKSSGVAEKSRSIGMLSVGT